MRKGDGAFEHVVLRGSGVRLGHVQQLAQVDDEALCRGQFAGRHTLPARDKGIGVGVPGVFVVVHGKYGKPAEYSD